MIAALTWLHRVQRGMDRILRMLVVGILGGMVLLAAAQILMRNVFSYSLFWGDDILQLALLWLVMAGALAAALDGGHIRINVLMRFVPRNVRPWVYAATHAFTAVMCLLLALQSVRLVLSSAEYGDRLFGDVPAWLAQLIMPAGFGLLTIHFAARGSAQLFHGIRRGAPAKRPS